MSMLFRRRCCCVAADPCSCPPGSPWTAGVTGPLVGAKVELAGVSISPGGPPHVAILPSYVTDTGNPSWGASSGGTSSSVYWFSGQDAPCHDGGFDDQAEYCQWVDAHLSQPSSWTVSGSPLDMGTLCDGGVYELVKAKCRGAGVNRSLTIKGSFEGAGVVVHPNLSGVEMLERKVSTTLTVNAGPIAGSPGKYGYEVVGTSNFRSLFRWDRRSIGVTDGECVQVTHEGHQQYFQWLVRWFYAYGQIDLDHCTQSSIVISNQDSPGYYPGGSHTFIVNSQTTYTCPNVPKGGVWCVGSGGTVTLTLIDCPGGGGFATSTTEEPMTMTAESGETTGDPWVAGETSTTDYPALWAELHRRPWQAEPAEADERAWLLAFADRIPCGECRAHYLGWLDATPPDVTDAEAYFEGTWSLHQSVNDKLGKPGLTLDEARPLYAP